MQVPTIQKAIIKGFLTDESFLSTVLLYLKPEYFRSSLEKHIVTEAINFYNEYRAMPTEASLIISVGQNLPAQENRIELAEYMATLKDVQVDSKWLLEKTEEFCKQQDFRLVLDQAILVLEGEAKKTTMADIVGQMQKSLEISFQDTKSHDYFRDAEKQAIWYKEEAIKIPLGLEMFDKATNGGIEKQTINVFSAGTGVGKTYFMCDFTTRYLLQGYKVLYVTLELSEHKIRQRIDANLLDIPMDNFKFIDSDLYYSKVKRMRETVKGGLKIQKYPMAVINVNHLRKLLNELNSKDNFRPDIVCLDYLQLMNSARLKHGDKHEIIESIAQECGGLVTEFDLALWTASQINREGYNTYGKNFEPSLSHTSQSMGLPNISDFFVNLTTDKYLEAAQHIRAKVLKNRYQEKKFNSKFIVGMDNSKMRVIDVEQPKEEENLTEPKEDKPSFDKSSFGKGMKAETTNTRRYGDFNFDDDMI